MVSLSFNSKFVTVIPEISDSENEETEILGAYFETNFGTRRERIGRTINRSRKGTVQKSSTTPYHQTSGERPDVAVRTCSICICGTVREEIESTTVEVISSILVYLC